MSKILKPFEFALAFVVCTAVASIGQQCPQSSTDGPSIASQAQNLVGSLVFHDAIRKWFELRLTEPQCGQTSVELIPRDRDWTPLEILRGCRVRSTGAIADSPTGYYSLDTYQAVEQISAVGTCAQQRPLPDYSKAKPDKVVHEYRVEMHVDYEPGDHPISFHVSSAEKELQPWQAYAKYMLTGGFVLYGYCGEGFVVDKVFGTPQASPSHFTESRSPDDAAQFDPEGAAASGKKDLHLGYTCVRKP